MNAVELDELRVGARSVIRVGDPVQVSPSAPGKHDGFVGIMRGIRRIGDALEVTVFGGPANKVPAWRTFSPCRLSRTRAVPTHRVAAARTAGEAA